MNAKEATQILTEKGFMKWCEGQTIDVYDIKPEIRRGFLNLDDLQPHQKKEDDKSEPSA